MNVRTVVELSFRQLCVEQLQRNSYKGMRYFHARPTRTLLHGTSLWKGNFSSVVQDSSTGHTVWWCHTTVCSACGLSASVLLGCDTHRQITFSHGIIILIHGWSVTQLVKSRLTFPPYPIRHATVMSRSTRLVQKNCNGPGCPWSQWEGNMNTKQYTVSLLIR